MSNIQYIFSDDGKYVYGRLDSGITFIIDSDKLSIIKDVKFYPSNQNNGICYLIDSRGRSLHHYLFENIKGLEIDHINLDVLDNRRENIRYCTHQQNQMNQPLQRNNKSGVSGVSFYPARNKYRARIKVKQQEIHLGYYNTLEEATMARNVGMQCMFGAYGRYNSVKEIPMWIRKKVIDKCANFSELSDNSPFFDFWGGEYA